MLWEIVFMLVILKIPVVYLCAVVWWAIRAEPRPLEGAATVASLGPAAPSCGWRMRPARVLPSGPSRRAGARSRRPGRVAHARVWVSR